MSDASQPDAPQPDAPQPDLPSQMAGPARRDGGEGIALSVVVPTFKERDNIAEIVARLDRVLGDLAWEVIFVDDASPDGTAEAVRAIARADPRVRLILRHNRRGLSSAVVEGGLAAAGDVVAVMDGDLQHDESVLPELYAAVSGSASGAVSGGASGATDGPENGPDTGPEIASASRFLREDGADGLSSARRLQISNTGIRIANAAFGLRMTDPLTGFFAMRRAVLLRALPRLSGLGFKILLDLVTAAEPRPRITELPFRFRERLHGESKLDNRVMYDFFLFFIEKKIGRFLPLPARFISFSMINAVGIAVHMAVLWPLVSLMGAGFAAGQLAATLVAMLFNYTVNNAVTYNDRRLRGAAFWRGFALFAVLCSIGVLGNVGVASMLHEQYTGLAYMLPALAGAVITVVWNYVATNAFVWGQARLPRLRRRAG